MYRLRSSTAGVCPPLRAGWAGTHFLRGETSSSAEQDTVNLFEAFGATRAALAIAWPLTADLRRDSLEPPALALTARGETDKG